MKADQIIALIDGEPVNLSEATISLSDTNYANGIGVYEILRQRDAKRYFAAKHVERLFHSAQVIGLKHSFSAESIINQLNKLRELNPQPDMNIRITMVKKDEISCSLYMYPSLIPQIAGNSDLNIPDPVGVTGLLFRGERQFPQAKSLSLLLSSIALAKAKQEDCWDAILVDRLECITEGSRSNILWVENGSLFSPPEHTILSGVTRGNIIEAASNAGIQTRFAELKLSELIENPRPVFVCSTSIGLQPLNELILFTGKRLQLPDSELTDKLVQAYRQFILNTSETD